MKLGKPTKEISTFLFDSDKNCEEVINFYKNDLKINKGDFSCKISENQKNIAICAEDINILSEVKDSCYLFLNKINCKYRILFEVEIKVDMEEVDAFEFMSQYLAEPLDEVHYTCLETRFIYDDSETCVIISIGVESENQIVIEAIDTLEEKDDLQKKYELIIAVIHKIIKY